MIAYGRTLKRKIRRKSRSQSLIVGIGPELVAHLKESFLHILGGPMPVAGDHFDSPLEIGVASFEAIAHSGEQLSLAWIHTPGERRGA
jgi:hypothetical protein